MSIIIEDIVRIMTPMLPQGFFAIIFVTFFFFLTLYHIFFISNS